MTKIFAELIADEAAASLTEYAMILALIAVAAIGALQFLGGSVGNTYTTVSDELSTVTGS